MAAQRFIDAAVAGDTATVCSLLSDAGKREILQADASTCEAKAKANLANVGLFRDVTVGRASAHGDRAVAIFVAREGSPVKLSTDALALERVDGEWLVTGGRKSTPQERGAKTAPAIIACLQKNAGGATNYGGSPQRLGVGEGDRIDGEMVIYRLPEEARRALAPTQKRYKAPAKLIDNVIVGYFRIPSPGARKRIESCA